MKVHLRTFGCRANQYDSEVIRRMVGDGGHEIVADESQAEVAIFNSCAVTAEAEADLRQAVRRVARAAPRARNIITGCAAGQPEATVRLAALPGVTDVIAGADFPAIARSLGLDVTATTLEQSGTRALLRIQDGCDEHCTFCATRLARGASRSRPAEAIIAEATALAARHAEIVVTGIHIGAWGADIESSLGALVELLVTRVERVRFRLSSLETTEVDDRLLELWRSAPDRLAPYLHAPLQSGSDAVLRRMGRHWYTAESYRRAAERIVERSHVFGLGADVIAGFPGESEDDHVATMRLIESLPFTSLHVFPYSARPGTAAVRLGKPVPPPIVSRRTAELRQLGGEKEWFYRARRIGGPADVIVVGMAGRRTGLTGDYLSVAVDPELPRGSRFTGRLELRNGRLAAVASPGGAT